MGVFFWSYPGTCRSAPSASPIAFAWKYCSLFHDETVRLLVTSGIECKTSASTWLTNLTWMSTITPTSLVCLQSSQARRNVEPAQGQRSLACRFFRRAFKWRYVRYLEALRKFSEQLIKRSMARRVIEASNLGFTGAFTVICVGGNSGTMSWRRDIANRRAVRVCSGRGMVFKVRRPGQYLNYWSAASRNLSMRTSDPSRLSVDSSEGHFSIWQMDIFFDAAYEKVMDAYSTSC